MVCGLSRCMGYKTVNYHVICYFFGFWFYKERENKSWELDNETMKQEGKQSWRELRSI